MAYYFDISFEETLKRHSKRPQAIEFVETLMKKRFLEKDYLELFNEEKFNKNYSENESMSIILKALKMS